MLSKLKHDTFASSFTCIHGTQLLFLKMKISSERHALIIHKKIGCSHIKEIWRKLKINHTNKVKCLILLDKPHLYYVIHVKSNKVSLQVSC